MAKILIVEDYLDLQEFFKLLLEMNKHQVKGAFSRKELDEQLISFAPDLILLDVMLEKEDGRQICKQIKKSNKEVSIILVSANPKMLVGYKKYDADDFIEKPFNTHDALKKINNLLAKKNKSPQ